MAFDHDMPAAAHRLLDAGNKLIDAGRRDVAGYLFGLAAECAVKAMATRIVEARRDEIFYAHFPELRTLLRDVLGGRSARPLLRLLAHDGFMTEWDIRVRYASSSTLATKKVELWQGQATQVVNLMTGEGA